MVESSGLLNRRRAIKLYRGFESPSPPDQKAAKLNVFSGQKGHLETFCKHNFQKCNDPSLVGALFSIAAQSPVSLAASFFLHSW